MKWTKFYAEFVDRNIGVISSEEEERLRESCFAVAGCGGIGGYSAEQLVRLGVGHLKIADFDNFETHNLSRQYASSTLNIGKNKAEVLAKNLKEINPELKLDVFTKGVQAENAEEFVKDAEAIIDGIDYACFYNSVLMHRAARKRNICIVTPSAIGFGATVLVFGPKTLTIEEYVGLSPNASQDEIKRFKIPIDRFAPYMSNYGDKEIAYKAAMGEINIPNIVMPQHLGTAVGVSEAVMIVLGRVDAPSGPKPRVFVLDLQDRKFEVKG